jgi:hypothetical protein
MILDVVDDRISTLTLTLTLTDGNKVAIVLAHRVCKKTNPGDLTSSKQQLGIMYEDE